MYWEGLQCLGHSMWTICRPLSLLDVKMYQIQVANSDHPTRGPILRKGNSLHWKKLYQIKRIATTFKIYEMELLLCLVQPNEIVHSPLSQFDLYLYFSSESDLKKKISLRSHSNLIQVWILKKFRPKSVLTVIL